MGVFLITGLKCVKETRKDVSQSLNECLPQCYTALLFNRPSSSHLKQAHCSRRTAQHGLDSTKVNNSELVLAVHPDNAGTGQMQWRTFNNHLQNSSIASVLASSLSDFSATQPSSAGPLTLIKCRRHAHRRAGLNTDLDLPAWEHTEVTSQWVTDSLSRGRLCALL